MKHALLLLCVLSITAIRSRGEDCDCSHYPFKPESCRKVCDAALVRKTKKSDLVGIVGLKESTANAVVESRKGSDIKSVDDLRLQPEEAREVKTKLDKLDASHRRTLAEKYGSSEKL